MVWTAAVIETVIFVSVVCCYITYKKKNQFTGLFIRYDGKKLGWQKYLAPLGFILIKGLPIKIREQNKKSFFGQFEQFSYDSNALQAYHIYLAQKVGEMIGILFLSIGLVMIGLLTEGKGEIFSRTIGREDYEKEDQYLRVKAEIRQGQDKYVKNIEIEVPRQEATQEQKEIWLGKGAEYIASYFREHEPYTEEPQFPASWGKVFYSYYSEEPEFIRNDGHLVADWPQIDRKVVFRIVVWMEELSTSLEAEIRIAGTKSLSPERQLELLQDMIKEGEYLKEKAVILPDTTLGGEKIFWSVSDSWRRPWVWVGGIAIALAIFWIQSRERFQKAVKAKQKQVLQAYPEMLNEVIILMGAGLTLQNAWFRITEKYERKKSATGLIEPLYEGMMRVSVQMKNGLSFAEGLKEFGDKIRVKEVRKFASLMLSDRKRGDEYILNYLKEMNEEAWEQRKKLVKEKTEEADTRLLLPLMMMLIVILIVVLAPAIMTIRG